MNKRIKARAASLVASMALLGGTAFVASGSTGAYFSDSHSGTITGSIGTIKLSTTDMNINFTNLLPGVPQTLTVYYQNVGNSPQDIYMTFPNATALSALNNLGHYGSVTVLNDGTPVFTSTNLSDNLGRCGSFSPTGTYGSPAESDCWPLGGTTGGLTDAPLLLASNVPSGAHGSFQFTFEYASALTAPENLNWNPYPLPGDNGMFQTYSDCLAYYASLTPPVTYPSGDSSATSACGNNQTFINSGDWTAPEGSNAGLPYQLVATQVGVSPGATGSKF